MWSKRNWRKKISGGKALEEYHNKASQYMDNPTLLDRLLNQAQKYLGDTITRRVGGIATLVTDIPLMIRLVRAWSSGKYQDIGKKNMVVVVAGLLYFVSPLDLIPDFLGVFGFIDDVAILGFVLSSLKDELVAFRNWEKTFG